MAELHGFARDSEFITEFDGEDAFDELVKESERPRYLRLISTTEYASHSNPFDRHTTKTTDEWVESRDIVVTITATKKAYDKYRWCDERIQRLESTIS